MLRTNLKNGVLNFGTIKLLKRMSLPVWLVFGKERECGGETQKKHCSSPT